MTRPRPSGRAAPNKHDLASFQHSAVGTSLDESGLHWVDCLLTAPPSIRRHDPRRGVPGIGHRSHTQRLAAVSGAQEYIAQRLDRQHLILFREKQRKEAVFDPRFLTPSSLPFKLHYLEFSGFDTLKPVPIPLGVHTPDPNGLKLSRGQLLKYQEPCPSHPRSPRVIVHTH